LGRTSTFTYDKRNLQTGFTDPLGHTTTTVYDRVGNIIAVSDALGQTTNFTYDSLYRQTAITDALGESTNFTYDAEGNLLSLTDPENNTTSYSYDEIDRLITETNSLGDARGYSYDAVGNLIISVDRNGRTRQFNYDDLDRNIREVWLDGNGVTIYALNYTYDSATQLTSIEDANSAYSYNYDLAGRLTQTDNLGTPDVPNVVLNYVYDEVNNLVEVRDSINGQSKGIEAFVYDNLNRVISLTQSGNDVADKRLEMSYDAASQMSDLTRYAGGELVAKSDYTYDEAGRLTNLLHDRGENSLAEYSWVYDEVDRITQLTNSDGTSQYNYDKIDQLVNANYNYQSDEDYSYDENGNRTNAGYVTGSNNQLVSDGIYNYEYDAEGNLIRQIEIATGFGEELTWDYRNRLTKIVSKDSSGNIIKSAEYTYDVFDRRIEKSVDPDGDGAAPAIVERFVYDGDHIALVFDGQGNQTSRYLHGTQIDQILAQEANGEVLWALTDNQGTVRDVVNSDGVVVNHLTYDSFGKVTGETNPAVDFRFGYTGRELDSETGLYYYRARYYNPTTGRFLSEDPISFGGGDANLYRYVENSPTNFTDPLGQKTVRELQKLTNRDSIDRLADKYNSYPPGNIPGLDKDKLSDFSDIKAVPDGLFDPNNINKPGSTSDLPFGNFPGTQLIPPSLDLPNSTIFPKDVPLDLPNVTTFPGASCPADYPYLAPPFFESSEPWRGKPVIEDGDSKKGWQHIDERHVTGNSAKGPGDLFEPGTTRSQLEKAAEQIVKNGTRISDPQKRLQSFEDRIKVNGKRDRVRVTVDTKTGEVITIHPVRSE
jgi:RHS repeat-associated protein